MTDVFVGRLLRKLHTENAIDFFVHVLGMSFHDAMRQITGP